VAAKLQAGEISLDDLAFIEGIGLTQWTPLRDVLAKVDGTAPIAVQPPSAPIYSYAVSMAPPPHLVYAGFWVRFLAYVIDAFIIATVAIIAGFFLSMAFILLGYLMGADFHQRTAANSSKVDVATVLLLLIMEFVTWAGMLTLFWLYFAKLESGPAQASYGKRVMGLRVTDLAGQRISFGRASGRTFGKFVSGMTFYVGFIMAGFTERKQSLHDMIAGTVVVRE
jgi:uncharacterized RDD family membrane protein YckC